MFRVRHILRAASGTTPTGEILVHLHECKLGCKSGSCVVKDIGGQCAANSARLVDANVLAAKVKEHRVPGMSNRVYVVGTADAFLQHKQVIDMCFASHSIADAAEDCLTDEIYLGAWLYPK